MQTPSTGESSKADPSSARPVESVRQPLDLRLMPAALAAWGAALTAVHSAAVTSLRLGAVLTLVGVLSAAALWLLPRVSKAKLWGLALQTVLCLVVSGCVMLSAGITQHRLETSGWNEAIKSSAPVEVHLRVSADPQPLAHPSPGEDAVGVRSRAVVSHARLGGEKSLSRVDAEVVLINRSPDAEELIAGQRYTLMAELAESRTGDQASALVIPFGGDDPQALEADQWTQLTGLFNNVRSATAEAAEVAVGEGPALLPGVALGDRSRQGQELTEAMRISGLSHMTVVSGTHCSLVMGALLGLLRIGRAPRWLVPPVLIGGLILYVMLVQPAPSVIRAAVMGSIGALAVFAGRGRASSALLCGCVILLLIYSPWFSVTAAFQLSVTATAGIVAVGHRLKGHFQKWMPTLLAGPLALAVSAQLFVTPVLLPIAEGITLYSVPANILAGPLLPFATVPATAAAVLIPATPWLSTVLLWLAGLPAAGIGLIGTAAASMPQALAPWPEGWHGWLMAALYVAAALIVCVPIIQARLPSRTELGVFGAAAGMLVGVVAPASGAFSPGLPDQWRIALCDVGQGDMLVVRTAERAGIVVDAGEEPEPAQECLQQLQVEKVDVLMITHDHRDHYGGTPGIQQAATIEKVIHAGSAGWSPTEALSELGGDNLSAPERRARVGEQGEHRGAFPMAWKVWAAADYHSNPNDNSLVTTFDLWDAEGPADAGGSANNPLRLLALGDLEEEVAKILLHAESLPEQVDVLKVSHHGAANGGTETIHAMEPGAALIGVGEDNPYGHPDAGILASLEEVNAAVYRTDAHGTVVFSLSAEGLQAQRMD